MKNGKTEMPVAVYLLGVECDESVEEHERLYKFFERDKLDTSIALFHFVAVVVTCDDDDELYKRVFPAPVFATNQLDDNSFILYDDSRDVLMVEPEDIIYMTRYPDGPNAIYCAGDIMKLFYDICGDAFGFEDECLDDGVMVNNDQCDCGD